MFMPIHLSIPMLMLIPIFTGRLWAIPFPLSPSPPARLFCARAPHVRIPAAYRAGITLFAVEGTPAATALRQAPELPLRDAE